ncbi:MAG: VWA domain-containing protein, partial [Nanoarchaeota archaeon]|nr:VWA domain-containing protein [Nanoarchaeota archaeon]
MICVQQYCLEQPLLLLLGIPIFFALLFFLFKDIVKFRNQAERALFRKRKQGLRLFMLFTRTLMVLCLLVAFARPFTTITSETHGDPVIKVLVDNSASMGVFGDQLLETVKKGLSGKPLDITQVAAGEHSAIGDGILKAIEGKDNLLLISDGRATEGKDLLDIASYARSLDTRLFALRLSPEKTDAWVTIIGPSDTIEDTTNAFRVRVEYVGSIPAFTLQVFIDDQPAATVSAQDMKPLSGGYEKELLQRFGTGTHTITAKLITQDLFAQNNIFYKSVKSIERPDVLFISSAPSPIEQGLKEIYDLTVSTTLPSGFTNFDAIVFDDTPYAVVAPHIDTLTGYLLDGGGLFFIGGMHAFDRGDYKGTLLESMLPVNIGAGKVVSSLENNIIIVLDVSESQAAFSYKKGGESTALDLGKGMALKMVDQFKDDTKVGLVAFASIGQLVTAPAPLSENRDTLKNDIVHLGKGQGTDLAQGLLWADIALDKVKGTKNIILISDGKMGKTEIP